MRACDLIKHMGLAEVCLKLEDEFGKSCSEPNLRRRLKDNGIAMPDKATICARNAAMPPWSQEKKDRFAELVRKGLPTRKIARALRDEFGVSHGRSTLCKKAGEMNLREFGSPRKADTAAAQKTLSHVSGISNLKFQPQPQSPPQGCPTLKALHKNCQFPIGEDKRDYRICGERPLLGSPYCEKHYELCYATRSKGRLSAQR
jgi:hypothetical protein